MIIFSAFDFQAAVFHSVLLVQLVWGTEWTSLQPAAVAEGTMTHSFDHVKWHF